MKTFFRKLHRWLGLLMALQIIAWMGSGLYFAIFPIETIRGEHLTREAALPDPGELEGLVTPAVAWKEVSRQFDGQATLTNITLSRFDGRTWYRVSGTTEGEPFSRLVGGGNGDVMARLEREAAITAALDVLAVSAVPDGAIWVTDTEPGSEIRGRSLPLWRIDFSEPESLRVYIDPWTGEVVARRTTRWRIFDFLWMLHIMDFDTRDDFNTPLLQAAAVLGLLVALSGVVFWAMTSKLFRNRRRQAGTVPG